MAWEKNESDEWEFTPGNGSQDAFTADTVNQEYADRSTLEADRREQAEAAGVRDARFASYADVLRNYEERSDTEFLRDRRARSHAVTADQQDFTRAADYTGNSTEAESGYPEETS